MRWVVGWGVKARRTPIATVIGTDTMTAAMVSTIVPAIMVIAGMMATVVIMDIATRLCLASFVLLSSTVSLTPQQQAQVKRLEESLLAPCCYTQCIAKHTSEAAAQMRDEVTNMVANGMSDQQIITHYKAIYGDQILIVPDGKAGKILFAFPLGIFLLALGILLLVLRRMLRPRAVSPSPAPVPKVTPSLSVFRERIERETGDGG